MSNDFCGILAVRRSAAYIEFNYSTDLSTIM